MSYAEKELLIVLAEDHAKVIENKKTDGVTTLVKNEEWRKIALRFNSQGVGPQRDEINLKSTWENLKKSARKVAADARVERIKTGGGPSKKIKTDPILDRVLGILGSSAGGLENRFDGDSEENHGGAVEPDDGDEMEAFVLDERAIIVDGSIEATPEQDWGNYTPLMLKSHINPVLRPSASADEADQMPSIAAESAPQRSASGEKPSTSQTPSWSRRRRPHIEKDGLTSVHKRKAEALTVTTTLSKEEHQWQHELHLIKVEQEKVKLELEKIKLEREIEQLKQDKIRTDLLRKELNK
ncbi:uncharacterized protein LOC124167223 [Ischnura elegans]|uniref:uncharacterized protein LOC124167223 n=1 Tax=Ischnura elegans TaxID=197161 RepID=UPI001ED8AEA4|nr:uncharacterized protein LOC124167223 [Ischnura elegans]